MKVSAVAAGLAASTLVIGVAATGCGSNKSSSPSSTTSSTTSASAASSSAPPASSGVPAQPSDYSNLLIKPTDIVVPGDTFTLSQTLPVPNPAGTEGVFMNQGGTRKVDDTIYVYPDPGQASQALDQSAKAIQELSVKAPPTPADVGTGGQMAVGPSPDGSKSKAIVMFTEGKVFTVLEFESPPNDPVQPDFVLDLGKKQDAAIKSGLPAS
ncbi:hypothetical protein [Mycobacterium sp. 852002-51057_SCH5723018]|uniref:hypothetical protein n=1 Tax=Mycobacterium sp. 852002-51057_SCH5723018 TaxID=1834094 RepID=UPI0008019CE8|nr:hypothetical protein [Mycobacterium sp. 852002-51057_SCH5723018]OBG23230.1 hypothetical protein A5764_11695 [Mycobacterium sp. 852002-51057_SCH5723018]